MTEQATAEAPEDAAPPRRRWSAVLRCGAEAVDWQASDAPAGDSPPLPRWPLYLSIAAWIAWMIFLVAMMVMRIRAPRV